MEYMDKSKSIYSIVQVTNNESIGMEIQRISTERQRIIIT
jgi:hypothetical protein